jgi:hypothetical protein
MIFLLMAAALVVGAPLVAAVLVSVASIHEDAAKSLAGRPPGLLAAAARRLLQARVGGAGPLQRWPRPAKPASGGRRPGQPERATQTGPIPASQRVADDQRAARSYGALATPRG